MRGLSGQLVLACDGKEYAIAFAQGAVVGATSPVASDSAVRVAITANLIMSTQVGEITRQLAAAPSRDEVELIGELTRLAPDQVQRLRRRLVAQRAARTFSVDRGEFIVDDRVTIPVRSGVYLGARSNLPEQRLGDELARLGAWFQLKPDAVADLPYFGFTDVDKPLLSALHAGEDLAELEVKFREHGERAVRAIVYALACCNACETLAEPRAPTRQKPTSQGPPPPAVTGAPTHP